LSRCSSLFGGEKNKKGEGGLGFKNCHAFENYVESGKADIACMKNTPHVPLRQIAEEKIQGKELRVV